MPDNVTDYDPLKSLDPGAVEPGQIPKDVDLSEFAKASRADLEAKDVPIEQLEKPEPDPTEKKPAETEEPPAATTEETPPPAEDAAPPEETATTETEPPATETEKPVEPPKELTEEEQLQQQFNSASKNASPKTRELFKKQQEILNKTKAELKEYAEKLKAAESRDVPDDVKAKLARFEELEKIARKKDWTTDARWQNHQKEVSQHAETLLDLFVENGVFDAETKKALAERGGYKFVGTKDGEYLTDGEGNILDTPEKYWKNFLIQKLPPAQQKLAVRLYDKVDELDTNSELVRRTVLKDVQQDVAADAAAQEKIEQEFQRELEAQKEKMEFLKPVPIAPNEDEASKAAKEEQNKVSAISETVLHNAISAGRTGNPKDLLPYAVAAAAAVKLNADNQALAARVTELTKLLEAKEGELTKLKKHPGVGKLSSIPAAPAKPKQFSGQGDLMDAAAEIAASL